MRRNSFILLIVLLIIVSISVISIKVYHAYYLGFLEKKYKDYELINPLLKYRKFREIRPFRQKILELIKKEKDMGRADDVAVYFRSLAFGLWMGIDEKKTFAPASVLKIPVMLTYFRLAQKDPGILDKKIKYIPGDVPYSGMIVEKNPAEVGKYYSVDELIRLMITLSDNYADKLLCDNLPPGELAETFEHFGIRTAAISPRGEFASLKMCAGFLRTLYNASYLSEDFSEKALRFLTGCAYRDGILAGLPGNITVAHKFGERSYEDTGEKQLHEFGIVYNGDNPYILGVMARGRDYKSLAGVIKDISELVYNEVSSQVKESEEEFYEED